MEHARRHPRARVRASSRLRLRAGMALVCFGSLLAAPASIWAKPPPRASATPAELRTYVSSGAYLTDVEAAVAPAKAFLAARMDELDRQRAACTTAGLALGTGALAAPGGTATTTKVTGRTILTLRRTVVRTSRLRLTASGASVSANRRVVLPVRSGSVMGTTARLSQAGTLVLHRGARRVVLRAVQVKLTGTSVSISAQVGGRRTTVLQSVSRPLRRPRISSAPARAAVVAAPLRLTHAGARGLRRLGLRSGRIGIVTVMARGETTTSAVPFQATAVSCRAVPSKPAMVLDIDETALSAYLAGGDPGGGAAGQAPELLGTAVALPPVLDLFRYARSRGVAVDFITARITPQSLNTGANLDAQGYADRIGVTFRSSTSDDAGQYKRDARQALQDKQGYTIIANVGDQCSDLYDGQAERSFKLPNTFYITAGKQDAACDQDG